MVQVVLSEKSEEVFATHKHLTPAPQNLLSPNSKPLVFYTEFTYLESLSLNVVELDSAFQSVEGPITTTGMILCKSIPFSILADLG